MGYYNAGDKGVFLDFAFNTKWFKKNIQTERWNDENGIKQYLSSAQTHILWNDIVPNAAKSMEQVMLILENETVGELNLLSLKINCLGLMVKFFQAIAGLHLKPDSGGIKYNEADKRHVAQAEKMLMDNLINHFPGIESMATTVHTSATKLKVLFKNIYGKTMFQYYQEKQMLLAIELLKQPSQSVKQVAADLGYENTSNFTAAFKKHYGFLPREVK